MALDRSERVLLRLALLVRFSVVALAILAQTTLLPLPLFSRTASGAPTTATAADSPAAGSFLSHYDSSAQLLFLAACPQPSSFDRFVSVSLGWQAHWDGLHFLAARADFRTAPSTSTGTGSSGGSGTDSASQPFTPAVALDYELEKETAFGLGTPALFSLGAWPLHACQFPLSNKNSEQPMPVPVESGMVERC
jgi:hypothetical protein